MLPPIEFKVCGQGDNPTAYNECEEFIKKWQKILNIQEWGIKLGFLSGIEIHRSMGSEDYNALCERTSENKSAAISINAESEQINKDLERTLIHELLHIVFDDYQTVVELAVKDDYARKIINLKMEQTIESLAKSFVNFIKESEADGNDSVGQ